MAIMERISLKFSAIVQIILEYYKYIMIKLFDFDLINLFSIFILHKILHIYDENTFLKNHHFKLFNYKFSSQSIFNLVLIMNLLYHFFLIF